LRLFGAGILPDSATGHAEQEAKETANAKSRSSNEQLRD
jgi:hypothetical protein